MNTFHPMTIFAMGTPPSGSGQGAPGGGSSGILMIGYMAIIFALFYFMMIRPQMKKEKERKKMIAEAKTGDRVLFAGGLRGTISKIKDATFTIKIADNVKVEVARGSILRVLDKDESPTDQDTKSA